MTVSAVCMSTPLDKSGRIEFSVRNVSYAYRGGATPGPGRSYALPLKNWDLAVGPGCKMLIKYTVRA